MLAEQIRNYNHPQNNPETLAEKHDELLSEAVELEAEANGLRKNLKAICEKNFPPEDKKREKEIELERVDITESLNRKETELKKLWEKIGEIQTELLAAENK